MKKLTGSLFRYTLTGWISTGVNVGLFWLLSEKLGIWYIMANVISFGARSLVKFTLLRTWAFQTRQRTVTKQVAPYLTLEIGGFLAGTGLLYALVEYAHLGHVVSLCLVIVTMYIVAFQISRHIFGSNDDMHN